MSNVDDILNAFNKLSDEDRAKALFLWYAEHGAPTTWSHSLTMEASNKKPITTKRFKHGLNTLLAMGRASGLGDELMQGVLINYHQELSEIARSPSGISREYTISKMQ